MGWRVNTMVCEGVFEGEGVWAGTTDVTFTVDMHR